MSKRNIIWDILLIIFILSLVSFGISSIFFGGLEKDNTDIGIFNIIKITTIVSGSLTGVIILFYLVIRFSLIYKVNKIYDYYVKQNHKYDIALEKFGKFSKLLATRFIIRYIDLHIAYTYLRLANYDKCFDLFNNLYESNKSHEYFMFSFLSLYYLILLSYVKDNKEDLNKYLVNINLLLEKNKKIVFNNRIYSTHIEIIKAVETGNKNKLRELILLQCDGDPNKIIFIKDICRK